MRAIRLCLFVAVCALGTAHANPIRSDLSQEDRLRVQAITQPTTEFGKAEPFEAMSAGAGTFKGKFGRDAFSDSLANLSFEGEQNFKLGNGLFRKFWVSSPSSTQASDGLGPLFNARSCQGCHLKDGRGRPPATPSDVASSLLVKLSIPQLKDGIESYINEPTYGSQFQTFSTPSVPKEGFLDITYKTRTVTLKGGEVVELRKPDYAFSDLGYGDMHTDVRVSPRLAQPMIGLGLLEAIAVDDILAQVKTTGNITGRAHMVIDPETGKTVLGRFGWKADAPSIRIQTANAFANDIGISSSINSDDWGDCTTAQQACRHAPHGTQQALGATEAPDPVLDLVAFYSRNLAVPARRDVNNPKVLRGKGMFYQANCQACHTPKYVTSRDAEQKEHQFQLIWPYTDMLLHNMGDDLADNGENGHEWRTPPLWGIGLTQTVSGHTSFMHDGRARNLLEAILWHGGEAELSREIVQEMPKDDRDALIKFLESL